jgi:hypothetical protein
MGLGSGEELGRGEVAESLVGADGMVGERREERDVRGETET